MKKEQKEKIVEAAKKNSKEHPILFTAASMITKTPEGYWVQGWIKVPLDAVK